MRAFILRGMRYLMNVKLLSDAKVFSSDKHGRRAEFHNADMNL
jgi:hypothetical protein